MNAQPMKITARLVSPVAGDETLPIDGIVLAVACELAYGKVSIQRPRTALPFDPSLSPFVILGEGADWFYSASYAQYPEMAVDEIGYWSKRFDTTQSFSRTNSIRMTQKGEYKNYHEPMATRHVSFITWYANGDITRTRELIERVMFIGKKRSQGWGEVGEWVVEPVEYDHSIHLVDGTLARAVPLSFGNYDTRAFRTLHPPYWDMTQATEVWIK